MEEKEKLCEAEEEITPPEPKLTELEKLQAAYEELVQENKKLEEQILRSRADFDNFRRRSRQQLADGRAQAIEGFAALLLPAIDNLERALAEETTDPSFKEGVELIYKQFLDLLAVEGIVPIEAKGKPFDHNLHEAVAVEETAEVDADTITEELLKGYLIGEKVLRHSKVKVAKEKTEGKDEADE